MTIATTTLASITDVNAQGTSGDQSTISDQGTISDQNTIVDTEQVKEYLNQAMQALDDGNNTLALEQVDLASDALVTMTGVSDTGEEGEEDSSGTTEEGAGEDADEAGDDDTNDEEDSESK